MSNAAYSTSKTAQAIPTINKRNKNYSINQKLTKTTDKSNFSSAPYLPNTTIDTFCTGHTSSLKNLQKAPKIQFHSKYG